MRRFSRDALGRIVEENRSGTYVESVYDPTGRKLAAMLGSAFAEARLALPGGGKAIYYSTGLSQYWHPDWLGSSRLETTTTRTVAADIAFAPYGETYVYPGQVDRSFTGVASTDTASDLYDFMFREYSPVQGRWISPDPAGLGAVSMANPQTWNRYAYVGNSPLNLVDPLGLQAKVCQGECPKRLAPPDSFGCNVDDIATSCNMIHDFLSDEAGALAACPNNNCNAVRFLNGAGGTGILQEWVPQTLTGYHLDIGGWKTIGTVSDAAANNCQAPFLCNAPTQKPTATISAVHPPTRAQIKAACIIVAINSNNGFGSVPGDSSSASKANGVVFKQDTQYPRPTTMNPSSPNINVLGPLAAPGIFVQASYQNCLSSFGVK